MLSRRIIRVKVMQALYTVESSSGGSGNGEARKILLENINQARHLCTYLVSFLNEVARYAEKDAAQKARKNLPTYQDLHVNTKIAGNEILWATLENPSFKKSVSEFKIEHALNDELIKKIYIALLDTEDYRDYISQDSRDRKSDRKIMEVIFRDLMLPSEDFISEVEEKFIHWDDDAEMMVVLVNSVLHKPAAFNFTDMVSKEKMDYATELLECVLDKKEFCLSLIKPKLKNWDAERIASIDMILMEMGVCEFLFFDTIPPKVTINEYIDLAKEYSTEQSGHFINGILDNIHKELLADNKIHKRNFKNSTL
ncbi:MAG: transcription antitermination factor NusB [Bacteroidota bacterium]|nr:transcription antitermination factor NusB [Bacteroidota bacterium]